MIRHSLREFQRARIGFHTHTHTHKFMCQTGLSICCADCIWAPGACEGFLYHNMKVKDQASVSTSDKHNHDVTSPPSCHSPQINNFCFPTCVFQQQLLTLSPRHRAGFVVKCVPFTNSTIEACVLWAGRLLLLSNPDGSLSALEIAHKPAYGRGDQPIK